jgi:hypothetical protein
MLHWEIKGHSRWRKKLVFAGSRQDENDGVMPLIGTHRRIIEKYGAFSASRSGVMIPAQRRAFNVWRRSVVREAAHENAQRHRQLLVTVGA